MMPFFALVVIESRLVRMLDGLRAEFGEVGWAELKPDDRLTLIKDKEQGYNVYVLEKTRR